jgi:hypothetical protein
VGETSLQGAVRCYAPCAAGEALNTTDLTCVPIPQSLENALAAANITIDFNTTEVYIVAEPTKLEDTLGAAASASNQTVIITLAPDTTYPQTQAYVFRSNVIILAQTSTGGRRRRQLQSTVGEPVWCVTDRLGSMTVSYEPPTNLVYLHPGRPSTRSSMLHPTIATCPWSTPPS